MNLPARVIAVNSARELSFCCVPFRSGLERDVGGGVMDNGEGTYTTRIIERKLN
jgi:hypothetical protein